MGVRIHLTSSFFRSTSIALHQAMETLRERDARRHELVLLRFFGGLEFAAIAELLGVSERTVMRDWRFARAFLHEILSGDRGGEVTSDRD